MFRILFVFLNSGFRPSKILNSGFWKLNSNSTTNSMKITLLLVNLISDSSHQTFFERTLTVNNKAQTRQQAFIQIIFHCHISNFFYLCRIEYKTSASGDYFVKAYQTFETPSSCMGAGQIIVRGEVWQMLSIYMPWLWWFDGKCQSRKFILYF